jgi:hypothetical protein
VSELIERKRPECLYIRSRIFVEHDSQKGIVIGKGGTMLKRIGAAARENLERFFRHQGLPGTDRAGPPKLAPRRQGAEGVRLPPDLVAAATMAITRHRRS